MTELPASNRVAADGHTYNKSATANATVAPTSGATVSAAVSSARALVKLSEVEIDFVTVVDMHWGTTGELLTAELAEEKYRVPLATYKACWAKPAIQAALVERGIDTRVKVPDPTAGGTVNWRHATLTPEQLIVANTMLDLIDTRNDRKKLNDLGVTTHKWNTWLRQPEFQQYLQGRAESLLGASQHDAVLALVDRVRSGDVKAIELYWEYTGKFIRANSASQASGGHSVISAEQVTNLVQSIIEIIVEEVDDAAVGQRISERLGRLITARTAANQLVQGMDPEQVRIPEIATERVITPEIDALMNAGVGSDT